MSASIGRILRQGFPLAVLILSLGLARQYAAGAGVFAPGGLVVQARDALLQLQPDFSTAASETPDPASASTSATLENLLADQPSLSAVPQEPARPLPPPSFQFSRHPHSHCRH